MPCLCKKHFRAVANYFDRNVAFMYDIDEKACVICNQIIFIEGARRFVQSPRYNADEGKRFNAPDRFTQSPS